MSDDDAKAAPERSRKRTKKQGTRTQQRSTDNIDNRLNRIKTKNKLIGEIQDYDLCNRDEDWLDGFGTNNRAHGALNDNDEENY